MDENHSNERETQGGRLAVRLKPAHLQLGFGFLVLLLVVGILPILSSCASYERGGLVLQPGADVKGAQEDRSACIPGEALEDPAWTGSAESDEAYDSPKESSAMRTAQVSGVWGQPAHAQELSATGEKPMIVYNGNLEVKVSKLKEAADKALKLIEQYQGYMSNMQEYNYETSQSVSITARVPAVKVIQFAEEVKKLGEVISSRLTGDEVTEEYFDLKARLEALRISEARLKEMLSRSGKLSDLLEIERELSNKQSQMNQVTGRMKYLEDRSAMATIDISLVTEAPPPPPSIQFSWDIGETFATAWTRLKYSLRGLLQMLIWIVVYIPIWGVIAIILWLLWRWAHRSGAISWEEEKKEGKPDRGP